MSDELRTLLRILAVSLPAGLVIGIASCKLFPAWCKRYVKFCHNRQWKLFAVAALFFGVLGIVSFLHSSPYFAVFFLAFCLFELYGLFAFGFKTLTPEQEKQIDESDPRKLRPFRFWKKEKTG